MCREWSGCAGGRSGGRGDHSAGGDRAYGGVQGIGACGCGSVGAVGHSREAGGDSIGCCRVHGASGREYGRRCLGRGRWGGWSCGADGAVGCVQADCLSGEMADWAICDRRGAGCDCVGFGAVYCGERG